MNTTYRPEEGLLSAIAATEPHRDPFAGSLEEQACRLWEQRPAVSSEPSPRHRRYMQLCKLVYASRYDLPTLPERIATFAAENDLPATAVTLEAKAIMTEWQDVIRGVQQ